MASPFYTLENHAGIRLLRLRSQDGTNRLTRQCLQALQEIVERIRTSAIPLVIAGNSRFFSAGAELQEISGLDAASAYEFSKMGQVFMNAISQFSAPVYAAVEGYCMGGGLDLALACRHRGAALGLITGWGGTQLLPRLVGKGRALEIFVAAEKITAAQALQIGLIEAIAQDPVSEAVRCAVMIHDTPLLQ